MDKTNNTKKVSIAVIAILLFVTVALVAKQSEFFQGRLNVKNSNNVDYSNLYLYKNQVVTVVTTPVTSVVTSDVTSEGGTSQVASAVTSPVASGVAVVDQTSIDRTKLTQLTATILSTIAQADFKKNPSKFTLSDRAKQVIVEIYESQNN